MYVVCFQLSRLDDVAQGNPASLSLSLKQIAFVVMLNIDNQHSMLELTEAELGNITN